MDNDSQSSSRPHLQVKRGRIEDDHDPDYAAPLDAKRLKLLEDNARSELGEKVKNILINQFEIEFNRQRNEILEIDDSILRVQQKLQVLRYIAARTFYSAKNLHNNQAPTYQASIHPAVKSFVGKRPKKVFDNQQVSQDDANAPNEEKTELDTLKVPRYIPPKIPGKIITAPVRGAERYCQLKKLVVGNVSRWIPVSDRDDCDKASHKWMVYVRGPKEEPNISAFVNDVVFFLHPSYSPHDVIHVGSHPFHVTRRGWGEFPIRIQVCFKNKMCKPINIIHNLKLDRSYTGIQTLGAETIVEVMVYNEEFVGPATRLIREEGHEGDPSSTEQLIEDTIKSIKREKDSDDEQSTQEKASTVFEIASAQENASSVLEIAAAQENASSVLEQASAQESVLPVLENTYSAELSKNEAIDSSKELNDPLQSTLLPPIQQAVTTITPPVQLSSEVDHDYFVPKNLASSHVKDIPTTHEPLNQMKMSDIKKLLVPSSTVLRNSPSSSEKSATATPLNSKVLVRCLNKNGTIINLPLALLRNAVVIKPYRTLKAGESLLRLPLRKNSEDTSAPSDAAVSQSASSKTLKTIKFSPLQLAKLAEKQKQLQENEEEKKCGKQTIFSSEKALENIRSITWTSVRDCVRVLAQEFSLINPKAENSIFRSQYPFTSISLEIFDSWNIGKRRGAEWCRAKFIQKTLEECKFHCKERWSTKEIFIWCRRFGYSPFSCWSAPLPCETTHRATLDLPTTLREIQIENVPGTSDESDEAIVEIEELENDCVNQRSSKPSRQHDIIPLDDPDIELTNWIADSIEKLGFKLGAELCEESFAPLSRILFSKIWKEVAVDMIRRSLSVCWKRNEGHSPDEIALDDTFFAVTQRPEFDFITNTGLGVNK